MGISLEKPISTCVLEERHRCFRCRLLIYKSQPVVYARSMERPGGQGIRVALEDMLELP